ncbi:hypothetical protein GCM10027187_15620 [Streptosporangium sandarakinum]
MVPVDRIVGPQPGELVVGRAFARVEILVDEVDVHGPPRGNRPRVLAGVVLPAYAAPRVTGVPAA